ncbi:MULTISPECIES: response regulator [Desulfitobacterium]|uniref:Transcriptional regulatory protein n=1 Tax=Desulfitobacterium dehalogenans (strain ATCC 51507 / DSM 9161 / JW/IU-DC1) TaxID=756499 RepID=I4ADB2_DESDJ|nr:MULTISPECIES: response regulator [Desulfitobacterium]AFM01947.1 response regulator of citrate/malate metabolism [Desulfitobacterium dehalogenans ATCC 51507]
MIKALIIEDDPMVAELNRLYLEQVGGFQLVASAGSAAEAMKVLKKKKVDLILLDIFMPGINGLEFLTQLRKSEIESDVIIVSASTDSQSIRKALQHGAVDYLIKPFEYERFRDALNAYKKRELLMKNKEKLSQKDLDEQIFNKEEEEIVEKKPDLPKGISRDTLKLVWDHILVTCDTSFTTEEMAQRVGISRVSMSKYISFLRGQEVLNTEISYGAVGRPVNYHRINQLKVKDFKQYLKEIQ